MTTNTCPDTNAERRLVELAGRFREIHERPVPEWEVSRFLARLRDARETTVFPLQGFRLALACASALLLLAAVLFGYERLHAPDNGVSLSESHIAAALPTPTTLLRLDDDTLAHAVTAGRAVHEAEVLETGPNERLVLQDRPRARVEVGPSTRLAVNRWRRQEAVLELSRGAVRSTVTPGMQERRYEVHTPFAVVSVVGTDFTVRHTPDHETVVVGHEGRVHVSTPDGRSLGQVSAGEELRISPSLLATRHKHPPDGAAAAPPRRLAAPLREPAAPLAAAVEPMANEAPVPAPEAARKNHEAALSVQRTRSRRSGPARPTTSAVPAPLHEEEDLGASATETAAAENHLEQARTFLAAGREEDAIALLLTLPNRTSRTERALGDAYLLAGRREEARAAYERALARAEGQPAPAVIAELARLVAPDDPLREQELWRRYLERFPSGSDAPEALSRLLIVAVGGGRLAEAHAHLRELAGRFPDSGRTARGLALLGRALLDIGDDEAAAQLFLEHLDATQRNRSEAALVGLLHARIAQGRVEDARALVAHYETRFPRGHRAEEVAHLARALPD